jgi:hypothetical protein
VLVLSECVLFARCQMSEPLEGQSNTSNLTCRAAGRGSARRRRADTSSRRCAACGARRSAGSAGAGLVQSAGRHRDIELRIRTSSMSQWCPYTNNKQRTRTANMWPAVGAPHLQERVVPADDRDVHGKSLVEGL